MNIPAEGLELRIDGYVGAIGDPLGVSGVFRPGPIAAALLWIR